MTENNTKSPGDVDRIIDEVMRSEPDAWIDNLTDDQAKAECVRRGLAPTGILPTLREKIRRFDRRAREMLRQLTAASDQEEGTVDRAGGADDRRAEIWRGACPTVDVSRLLSGSDDSGEIRRRSLVEGARGVPGPPGRTAKDAFNILRRGNFKFTGEPNEDPNSFLERVREWRGFIGASDEDMLQCVPFLLDGVAALWYRTEKEDWADWREFEAAFRQQFGAPDFQEALEDEIRARTQGESERVADYFTYLNTLFERLDPPWPGARKVERLYRNLLPRLRLAIRRTEFTDYRSLKSVAMRLEADVKAARQFRAPPPPERALCPSSAYKPSPRGGRGGCHTTLIEEVSDPWGWVEGNVHTTSEDSEREVKESRLEPERGAPPTARASEQCVPPARTGRSRGGTGKRSDRTSREGDRPRAGDRPRGKFRCYNCNKEGHFARECPEPPREKCEHCGSRRGRKKTEPSGNEAREE